MRMTEYQLIYQSVTNNCYIKVFVLLAYPRIEGYMQQDVTQLLANLLHVLLHQGVAELIGFLYRVGAQTLVGLLAVPRTFLTQGIQHVEHTAEGGHLLLSCMFPFLDFHRSDALLMDG